MLAKVCHVDVYLSDFMIATEMYCYKTPSVGTLSARCSLVLKSAGIYYAVLPQ